jgi:putative CocE/NonD family hydrolase
MLKKTLCLFAFAVSLLPSLSALGQSASEVSVERGVAMKTRDGVTLYADIYRPAGEGPFPVLLQRTPYDKNNASVFAHQAVARGFMVVVQDVRGRYTSEGEWYPFKHETDDGYDTVEWAAALPHSNGKVGMFGGSYVGATQMLTAIGHPPHLAGICPVVTASNYHENWTYQGGAFEQWFDESWTSGLAQDTANRAIRQSTNALLGSNALPLKQYPVFNIQTGANGAVLTRVLAPYFLDWLDHPAYDSYWKQWSIEENFASIQVPALTIAAWYDLFQGGSLRNYLGIKAHGGSEAARNGQRLLIAIGGHSGWPSPSRGTNTCSRASKMNSPQRSRSRYSLWARTSGAMRTTGLCSAPRRQDTFCTPPARPTVLPVMAPSRSLLRPGKLRTALSTTQPTPFQRWADLCAATACTWRPAPGIRRKWRAVPMC